MDDFSDKQLGREAMGCMFICKRKRFLKYLYVVCHFIKYTSLSFLICCCCCCFNTVFALFCCFCE